MVRHDPFQSANIRSEVAFGNGSRDLSNQCIQHLADVRLFCMTMILELIAGVTTLTWVFMLTLHARQVKRTEALEYVFEVKFKALDYILVHHHEKVLNMIGEILGQGKTTDDRLVELHQMHLRNMMTKKADIIPDVGDATYDKLAKVNRGELWQLAAEWLRCKCNADRMDQVLQDLDVGKKSRASIIQWLRDNAPTRI